MSLTPISQVTFAIEQQPEWDGIRHWKLIVRAWMDTVSPAIASRSRPRSLARGVLTIATHSASLAHQLTFGRAALLVRLNSHLSVPINELRFAPIGFDTQQPTATDDNESILAGEIVVCTHCDCRARQGEIQRWGFCQYCAIDLGIVGGKVSPKM